MKTNFNIDSINKFKNHKADSIGPYKYYSVLVPFVEKDGELYLLYEVRARHMNSQPGEICFPGGLIENDEDALLAAKRETSEELGLPLNEINIVGPSDILYGYANYTIFPYVGTIDANSLEKIMISKDEVEEIFLINVKDLIANPPEKYSGRVIAELSDEFPYEKLGIGDDYPWRRGKWEIPIYDIDGRIIWGLTARITDNVIRIIADDNKKQTR